MSPSDARLFIITGGPGSGKTSLIAALGERGVWTAPEAGRAVIQDQVVIGGDALPWGDRARFAELMLSWELRTWRDATAQPATAVLDRGLPDVLGYLRLCGLPEPPSFRRACEMFRYAPTVFIAPPWPEIFGQDAERRQDWDEARRTHGAMREVYAELGYALTALPLGSIEERADFVWERLRPSVTISAD